MEKDLQLPVTMLIECTREIHKLLGSFLQAADKIPLCPEQPHLPEGHAKEAPAGSKPAPKKTAGAAAVDEALPAPSYEDVRGILTEKSLAGYKADVKTLLTRHGLARLSDVQKLDEAAAAKTLRALKKEAEAIGNA